MIYAILDKCDRCGYCVIECALDAIEVGKTINRILPERCNGCGACPKVCPLGVIVPVPRPAADAGTSKTAA